MADSLNKLERNILKLKGVTDDQLDAMGAAGIAVRADFATVGDAATLLALVPGLKPAIAEIVMAWAQGRQPPPGAVAAASAGGPVASVQLAAAPAPAAAKASIVLASPELVCPHCKAKQPKGRKIEEMCAACGQRLASVPAANAARPGL